MPKDPYAVLRALLRADAVRNAPKPPRTPTPNPQASPQPSPPTPDSRPVLDDQPHRSPRRNPAGA
ncbi:hypothetical protein [Streptomyces sp. NPDC050535]|uniref:hypothetical protein n=1 Tax=Streptomyces sp. NPDC050535 TaxID=3365626 RepID=UPI0037A8AAF6